MDVKPVKPIVLAEVSPFRKSRRFFRFSFGRTKSVLCEVQGECPEDGLLYVVPIRDRSIQPQVIMKSQVIKYI